MDLSSTLDGWEVQGLRVGVVSRPGELRANSVDSCVVLFLRTVRRNCSIDTRLGVFAVPVVSRGRPRGPRTNSLSGMSPMPIVEAVRLFPAPFLLPGSANGRWLVAVPPG